MRCILRGLLLVGLTWFTSVVSAQPPAKDEPSVSRPPWQRLLEPQQQQQVDLPDKQINSAIQDQKWDQAGQAAEELAQLRDQAQGADHWQAVDARIQLQTLRRLAGRKPEEQRGYFRAVQQARQAQALEQKGQARTAQLLRQEVLDLRRQLLGEDHPATATAYNNLAVNQKAQGKYAEAEQSLRKALEICRKALGEDHPDTASTYNNLALNQNAQGKYCEAEMLFARAAEAARRGRSQLAASGLERTMVGRNMTWMVGLPALLARNGKPEAAWQRYEDTLGRGSKDDLATRLRYSPDDQPRLSLMQVRLQSLEQQQLPLLALAKPDPAQQKRLRSLFDAKLQTLKDLDEHHQHLEATYGPVAGRADTWQALQAALPADTALLGWPEPAAWC